jgi:hypothetical protein
MTTNSSHHIGAKACRGLKASKMGLKYFNFNWFKFAGAFSLTMPKRAITKKRCVKFHLLDFFQKKKVSSGGFRLNSLLGIMHCNGQDPMVNLEKRNCHVHATFI